MEQMYLDDLANATEIVLSTRNRVRPLRDAGPLHLNHARKCRTCRGERPSHRQHGGCGAHQSARARPGGGGDDGQVRMGLSATAVLAVFFPRALAIPFAVLGGWIGISLLVGRGSSNSGRRPPIRRPRARGVCLPSCPAVASGAMPGASSATNRVVRSIPMRKA